ncbi:MAG: DUF2332 domain-containing protein [Candidatus Rokubacteria bacterium]|nr:DUF2332 domain-containing protein [Candidatus Rokubacteria bacterium]
MDSTLIAQTYRRFAERECKGYAPTDYDLALAAAGDDDIVAFLTQLPVAQPNLFFAAIQLLAGPDGMPARAALPAFVARRADELAAIMRSRRTQTNEVGRCAVLLPALPPGPLALLEVGASAGLCLLLDRFRYDFGSALIGDPSSPVHLRCAVAGPAPLPPVVPRIVWRAGLDARPVDVHDDDATRWLLACVWADHRDRRRRLEAAIEMARKNPPVVGKGDLVDDLPALLAEVPDDAQLVVFHSAVLTYVAADRRQAFAAILAETSRRRDVVWLSDEAPGVVPELTAPALPSDELRFLLGRTRFTSGRRRDELLAVAHPHGTELTWL